MGAETDPSSGGTGASADLSSLEDQVVEAVFDLQPTFAVFLGLHRYDGRLPDLSPAGTDRWVERARTLLGRLERFPVSDLPIPRRFDRTLLSLLLESAVFDLEDTHDYDRNPMIYVGQISLTPYLVRAYEPADERVRAMTQILEAVPEALEVGRKRLQPALPEPFLRLTFAIGGGLPSHFAEAQEFATGTSRELGIAFEKVRGPAEEAVSAYLGAMRQEYLPRSTSDFALGPARFQRLLWVREGIRSPFDEILERGRADLRRNQARLAEIAQGQRPPVPVPDLLERLFREHPTAERLIPQARGYVDEVKRFVESRKLVSIPDGATCRVEETPTYGRATSTASMNPPGPFDEAGDEGIYFVTPVDPGWTPEQQEEWLRSFNSPMLRNITVHEVYPGHYLQFLHFRRSTHSLSRKAYLSTAFTEGWAHYCEQLSVEAGLGAGTAEQEAAQIHDALLRDCRLIASIGLHTQGMTLPEATALFQREAYFEELPAQREALRGTFNPEYFAYTLGKLAILDLRTKYLTTRFGGSLLRFHDQLLSFGCPPVGMLDELIETS
ncbi:MAG: DUF885 domain-containing protein [Thermoplasmata archaeon]